MTYTPHPPDPHAITRNTAAHRHSSNPITFLAAYLEWTERITSPVCTEDEPLLLDDLALATQIEAYAAARRRDAYTHHKFCRCDACKVRLYGAARTQVAHLAA